MNTKPLEPPDSLHLQAAQGWLELGNHIVRLRYPQLLSKPGFVRAELTFKKPIPRRRLTPELAADPACLEVKLLTKT
jgi:hypothetical protein